MELFATYNDSIVTGPEKTCHITAQVPNGLPPVLSNSFVRLTDDTVKVIPMKIRIKLVGFWHALG